MQVRESPPLGVLFEVCDQGLRSGNADARALLLSSQTVALDTQECKSVT